MTISLLRSSNTFRLKYGVQCLKLNKTNQWQNSMPDFNLHELVYSLGKDIQILKFFCGLIWKYLLPKVATVHIPDLFKDYIPVIFGSHVTLIKSKFIL